VKIVLGMVLLEGSLKEVEKLLEHPEIRELLLLQKELMDEKKAPPAYYYTPGTGTAGNV